MPAKKHTATAEDLEILTMIDKRAQEIAQSFEVKAPKRVASSVLLVHEHINRLDLRQLLMADDFNFVHDVWGIDKHLIRRDRKLSRAFMPRFAMPDAMAATKD
jgi:hypothetical protein